VEMAFQEKVQPLRAAEIVPIADRPAVRRAGGGVLPTASDGRSDSDLGSASRTSGVAGFSIDWRSVGTKRLPLSRCRPFQGQQR